MNLFIKALLFLFIGTMANAQSFQGVITDFETGKPISQITIVSADQTYFVTSNEKGEVVLPQEVLNKKLFINDYQYEYSEKTFTNTRSFVWELIPNSETLEEIVIYENPEIFLDEIIENSIKSFNSNIKLEAYYRENYFESNRRASFAEGIVDFYINHNLENVQMVTKQSRVKDFVEINQSNRDVISSPQEVAAATMRFHIIRKLIKDKNYELYITAKKVGDNIIHTCYINPKEKSKKRFLLNGYFVFDETKKLILETSYAFAPEKKTYNTTVNLIAGKIDFIDMQFKSKYIAREDFYYPSYAQRVVDLISNSRVAKVKNERVQNQVYFYVLSTDKTTRKPTQVEVHTSGNLYSRGNKYTVEFWKNPKIINLSE